MIFASGFIFKICALRRGELVPIAAFAGSSASFFPLREIKQSRGSALSPTVRHANPVASSSGRSFRRVHREVDFSAEQSTLDFFHEPAWLDRFFGSGAIALRREFFYFHDAIGKFLTNQCRDVFCLNDCQTAAARAERNRFGSHQSFFKRLIISS